MSTAIKVVGDKYYRHMQGVASTLWTINHNLNKRVSVTVVDSSGRQVFGQVDYISDNQATVAFRLAFAGEAFCN